MSIEVPEKKSRRRVTTKQFAEALAKTRQEVNDQGVMTRMLLSWMFCVMGLQLVGLVVLGIILWVRNS